MAVNNHLLIIGTVWPEPNSSAAGSRMLQLIDLFMELDYQITFSSPTLKTEHAVDLTEKGIDCFEIKVNSAMFDVWIKDLNPSHVMFDRFMMEEQFGWRVAEQCPDAFRILDTEDLHCLRKTRQYCFKNHIDFSLGKLEEEEITKREIASILRSDLSIMISAYEIDVLKSHFQIPDFKLFYLPFLIENNVKTVKSFQDRNHFMTIGSFRHEPNVDSVLFLKKEIWPLIRTQLPQAELHIYGSYPKQQITQLNNIQEGFIVKGWTEDVREAVENARVMLAPLRFGAGQKGKFIDALKYGTPSVTTSIGAEGMVLNEDWSGFVSDDKEALVAHAIELYSNETVWTNKSNRATGILKSVFHKEAYKAPFNQALKSMRTKSLPFYMEALIYHSFRNSRFMSKWIEEKNRN